MQGVALLSDVACDSKDNVYLLARVDPAVYMYDRSARFVRAWGGGAVFDDPHGITIDHDDAVYVTDRGDHVVKKFTPGGTLIATIGVPGVGSDTGYDPGSETERDLPTSSIQSAGPPFNHPTATAVAENGDIYVSDGYGNARIHHFARDGTLLNSWGQPGTGPGQFHNPHAVAFDPTGRVVVCDRENDRLQFFTKEGSFVKEWANVRRPSAAVFTRDGSCIVVEMPRTAGERTWLRGVVTDRWAARLTILDPQGVLVGRIGGDAMSPCAPGQFTVPHGAAVDSSGSLYVVEVPAGPLAELAPAVAASCHQIQKFTQHDIRVMSAGND